MIRLALFDMDGTVFESNLNWREIRRHLQIEPGAGILEEIYSGDRVDEPRLAILERYEKENALQAGPIPGADSFLAYLKSLKVNTVLITNNNRENAEFLLDRYGFRFDMVVTRETGYWKPSPGAFLHVMEQYRCGPSDTISIGDSHYDVLASRGAGLSNIFIIKPPRPLACDDEGVVYFDNYRQLQTLFEGL